MNYIEISRMHKIKFDVKVNDLLATLNSVVKGRLFKETII